VTRLVAIVLLACGAALAQTPAGVFHTATHAKNVNVAVFDGDRIVTNLGTTDFDVRDNGVRQTLTAADLNLLPIDLRLVFDTSGSISEEELARYLKTMQQVAATLEPRDRCEIITFTSRIADAAALQHPPIKINLTRAAPDGTAFFDAVIAAVVTVPTTERRQVTILLSDAQDNSSFFNEAAALDAARLSDGVVYTILPGNPLEGRELSVSRLTVLSLVTGGKLVITNEHAVDSVVIDAIREFRQSYVLRYNVTGVPINGWHDVEVKVRGGYRVRARAGYFGG
jgi:VWFA-related protein